MGLAAPKRRNKLSHDPNNTEWSNATNSYGQKILSAQGWKPGEYLGARDARHAEHYTAANKAHIKILLREDNLGLGAQVGKSNAGTFGLSLYSGVLSRLNGKSDADVEKQQSALRDAELRTYQANKYGFMNFVRGGVLVGDTIKPMQTAKVDAHALDSSQRGMKRRRLHSSADEKSHNRPADSPRNPKVTKTNLQDGGGGEISSDESPVDTDVAVRAVKKKSKKKHKESLDREQPLNDLESDKRALKQQKRARKEERRKRKEEKRQAKAEKQSSLIKTAPEQQLSDEARPQLGSSTPNANRLAVRHRYIHQKRMASLDPQAMREIFMLKAGA